MSGTLEGVIVVDLTQNLPGPYATQVLAGMGATVWKVEPPKGDPARWMGPLFARLNAGKESVSLDLRSEAGLAELRRLVERAHVFVEGFRPGVIERLGCGPEVLLAWNPRLIICRISAYGQEGPLRREPGHDLNVQALAGLCALERGPGEVPRASVLPAADLSAAMAAVVSILGALRGEGGVVLDVAMLDTLAHWAALWDGVALMPEAQGATGWKGALGRVLGPRLERLKLYALPHYGLFECKDGGYVALGVVEERVFWEALCGALGLGRLRGLSLGARVAAGPVVKRLIGARMRRWTRDQAVSTLSAAGVPVTAVLAPGEFREGAERRAWLGGEQLGAVPALDGGRGSLLG